MRDAVAADLELVLGDLARWVAHDSPSGAGAELDALAAELASTLSGYGLACELVPAPAGLHVHASLRGRRAGARRAALPSRHRLPARHRRAATAAARGRPPDRARRRRHEGRAGRGGTCGARAGRRVSGPSPGWSSSACLTRRSAPSRSPRRRAWRASTPCCAWSAAGRAELSSPHARAAAGSTSSRCGRSAHAGSEPEHGRNAVLALARELPRIAGLDGARPGLTLHVTRMHGGDVLNSIPGEARATIDMRGWHDADLEWAEGQLLRVDPHRDVTFSTDRAPGDAAARADRRGRRARRAGRRARRGPRLRRCPRPPPEASPTAAGRPARGCRRWTVSAPSARSTTRRTSTSRCRRLHSAADWSPVS